MKRYLFTLAFALAILSVYAQSDDEKIAHFDKDWNKLPDTTGAVYYRTVKKVAKKYIVRDHYKSGKLQMNAECRAYEPELRYDGTLTHFYEHGDVQDQATYDDGKLTGTFVSYYENGQVKEKREHVGDKTRYLHYFTDTGRDILIQGTGLVTDVNNAGDTCYSRINDYELKYEYSVRRALGDTLFSVAETQAEFPNGLPALMKFLQNNVSYPKSARWRGVEGLVHVTFVVGKDGNLSEFKVTKRVNPDLDQEALRVVMMYPRWTPGRTNGKPVKSHFTQPISFRLAK